MSVALRNLPTHSLGFFFGILSPTPSMIVIGRKEADASSHVAGCNAG
jgi:hypothetical protein